jgi:hypothetical protein
MNSKRPTDLSAYYKLTAIFFIAVTAIFLIAGIVLKDREYSSKEKRMSFQGGRACSPLPPHAL